MIFAELSPRRLPDEVLLCSSSCTEKFLKNKQSFFILSNKDKADAITDTQNTAEATAHMLRLGSVSAVHSQLSISILTDLFKDSSLSPSVQVKLKKVLTASQVALSAVAESAEIARRVSSAAAYRERDIWLDSSTIPADVVKEAKRLPFM